MSLPGSPIDDAAPAYRKPRADVFTALLAIALAAMILGMVFLHLEMDAYEYKWKGGQDPSTVRPSPAATDTTMHPPAPVGVDASLAESNSGVSRRHTFLT